VPKGELVWLEMSRLLFGEAAAVAAYCLVARTIAIICCKVLLLPTDHYIDDFVGIYRLTDDTAVSDLKEFVVLVLKMHFKDSKFKWGQTLVYIGLQVRLARDSIRFSLHANRRWKYIFLLRRYCESNLLYRPEAEELAGRLMWACTSLYGRCGRAYIGPIYRRGKNREAQPFLNGALRRALEWWQTLFRLPEHTLTRTVPTAPRLPSPPAVSYTDASTAYGLGGVLYVLRDRVAFFWRTPVPKGDLIAFLEVEAAAVGDAVFGPLLLGMGIRDEVTFVDNNVSLPWITSGCSFKPEVDEILSGLWLNLATRGTFKWWERVSSGSNPSDEPSRGLVPVCPRGWRLHEMLQVGRWDVIGDGNGVMRVSTPLQEHVVP
jgi:hypothetical protein